MLAAGHGWHSRHRQVTFAATEGTVTQRSELTPAQCKILGALKLPKPPRLFDFSPVPELPPGPEAA